MDKRVATLFGCCASRSCSKTLGTLHMVIGHMNIPRMKRNTSAVVQYPQEMHHASQLSL